MQAVRYFPNSDCESWHPSRWRPKAWSLMMSSWPASFKTLPQSERCFLRHLRLSLRIRSIPSGAG